MRGMFGRKDLKEKLFYVGLIKKNKMPKIKLKKDEAKRLSQMLKTSIQKQEADFQNTSKQDFVFQEKKENVLQKQKNDIDFLKTIKEKIDIELFGRNG